MLRQVRPDRRPADFCFGVENNGRTEESLRFFDIWSPWSSLRAFWHPYMPHSISLYTFWSHVITLLESSGTSPNTFSTGTLVFFHIYENISTQVLARGSNYLPRHLLDVQNRAESFKFAQNMRTKQYCIVHDRIRSCRLVQKSYRIVQNTG